MADELTVTQFNERVNSVITNSGGLSDVSVIGELSGVKRSTAGHIYFDLKDANSIVRCTLFRFNASRIRMELKDGMKVIAFGSASYYAKGGSFNFNIESLTPYGKGDAQRRLEELTAKLLKEGLFDAERKRTPPRYPKVIGVVTSPTGAVIKDIIDTTARRYPVDILLAPAIVQGEDAPITIVSGIRILNEMSVDVIIVGRGGGSKEDLGAFDSEMVVRAVVESKVPVISAVGHATDKSLTDMAADRYAETPTAAAMIATPDRVDELRNISNLMIRASRSIEGMVASMRARFDGVDKRLSPRNAEVLVSRYASDLEHHSTRLDAALRRRIDTERARFDVLDSKLDPSRLMDRLDQDTAHMTNLMFRASRSIENMIASMRSRFDVLDSRLVPSRLADRLNQDMISMDNLSERMDRSVSDLLKDRKNRLTSMEGVLNGLDPNRVLDRGYSMIMDREGNVITSIGRISEGDDVTIRMRDGKAIARIKEVE